MVDWKKNNNWFFLKDFADLKNKPKCFLQKGIKKYFWKFDCTNFTWSDTLLKVLIVLYLLLFFFFLKKKDLLKFLKNNDLYGFIKTLNMLGLKLYFFKKKFIKKYEFDLRVFEVVFDKLK